MEAGEDEGVGRLKCSNCGEESSPIIDGRCVDCNNHFVLTGKEREQPK